MPKRIECIVLGRVQMVMFRDFTRRKAEKCGIVGTVENLNDGSVFVVAEGEEENLKKLIEYLKKGPPLASVEDVHVNWKDATGEFSTFRIIYSS